MSSLKDLIQQREALERQIAEAKTRETASAVSQVRALIAEFDLTQEDIFPTAKARTPGAKKSTGKVAPKYINKETGDTWTGRGKPPKWIQDKDRSQFLIPEAA